MLLFKDPNQAEKNIFQKKFSNPSAAEKFDEFNGTVVFKIRQKWGRYRWWVDCKISIH